MTRRRGLQAEVLASLAVVMAAATLVVGAVLEKAHEAHVAQLRELAARALVADLHSPLSRATSESSAVAWWTVERAGEARPRGAHAQAIDRASRALAAEAQREGRTLLQSGPLWGPVRIAVPLGASAGVAVARLPAPAPRAMLFALMAGNVAIFTVFGAYLLRGRLVLPLQRLASVAREIADGALHVRASIEGVGETGEVAAAFNEMTDALEGRTLELEKAVAELRQSNRRLREARAGLDRAERLAAVGRLAAGVAHEVGNPLGALLAFLGLVRRDAELSEASRQHLARAAREGERVRVILRQLLDFSRPPRPSRAPVHLPPLCEETATLIRAQRRYREIAIEIASEGSPPPALADASGVAQIVLNLLLNAADALAGAPDPRIRVSIRPAPAGARPGLGDGPPEPPRERAAVECVVEDNGPGIGAEDRERVFDPFFTTKPPGEGTGLGLCNALRFAEEFGGSLELDASPRERGAAFVLRLPAAPQGSAPGLSP